MALAYGFGRRSISAQERVVYLERDARFLALPLEAAFLTEPVTFEAPFLRAAPFLAARFFAGFLVAEGISAPEAMHP